MKSIITLFTLLVIVIGVPLLFNMSRSFKLFEGYSNYNLEDTRQVYKENDVLIPDIFPITGINSVSNKRAGDVWWQYPIFKVGSYAQITNNIRYPRNADTGRCMPEDFCDAIYLPRENKTNYVNPLPPVNPDCGTRVGYFTTDQNLLPFRTDTPNIMY
jgi:hypothetical protein